MKRIGSWLVLSFRLNRWEVLASAAGVALLTGGMVWFAWQLRALAAAEPGCLDPSTYVAACEQAPQAFYELSNKAEWLSYLAWVAPFGMGLVLGVPLVSREIEQRTAGISWTLSRSRTAWLMRRVAFAAIVLVCLLLVLAIAGEVLGAAQMPTHHLDRDFAWYGRRGGLLIVRGLAALGIGVVLGAVLGRVLPALLVAAFASVLAFTAMSFGMDRWIETDAVVQATGSDQGARYLGQRIELPSGEVIDYAELTRRGLSIEAIDEENRLFASATDVGDPEKMIGWDRIAVVPGRLYPQIVLRESAVVGGVALLLGLVGAAVVGRRRPG